ncbi:hypothetical protein P8452_15124 [Trifolium repens]|nr:hypothetical protein P8452_15124 [Trifolium repens]
MKLKTSRVRNISIRTGVLDEKAAATQALGLFAQHTTISYARYLEETPNALTAAHAIFQSQNEGAAKAKEILDTVMDIFIKSMVEDDDKEVVAQACTNVADIIRDYGYATLEPYLPELVHATLLLLQEKSACQQIESDSEIDDENSAHDEVQLLSHEKSACQQIESDSEIDDENSAHDEVLMDGVSDLLPAFAKAMGAQFVSIFAQLFDPLMKFAVKSISYPQDRTMVVACLAEVAQNMGFPIAVYVDRVMPLVLKEIVSSEATNRRNAAFCVGELCKNGGDSALKYYDNILRGLHPLFVYSFKLGSACFPESSSIERRPRGVFGCL